MDLARMLTMCRRDQWSVGDLDWDRAPRAMTREEEESVVQYFTDMAGIERLAAALFHEQHGRAEDPCLEAIFASFVRDELRHAHCAQMLADHYDVHRYRSYRINPALVRFTPHFVAAIRHLSNEIANAYITAGELILDIALLRAVDDYVADPMSAEAMELINRDESRHIAVDYHMVEYYSSPEYVASLADEPRKSLREQLRGWRSLGLMLWYAQPFFRAVFFETMDRTDPSGRRMREAFKRIQLISRKSRVRKRPFIRVMTGLQDLYNHPIGEKALGGILLRVLGVDPRYLKQLWTDEDLRWTERASFDDISAEALQAKYAF
jgi:hypothetical protein